MSQALEIRRLFIISAAEASTTVVFEPSKNICAVCLQGFSNINRKKTQDPVQGSSGHGLKEQQQK